MRILVLGLDSPLGYSLRSFAAPLMRHEIVGVDMDATRWRRERQVKKLIRRQPIDLILDARLVTQIDGVDPVGQPDIERTRWLAALAARDRVSYLYLSSARVFSGKLTRPYRETDQPDATDAVGQTLIEVEELLKGTLEHVFILRLGLMFGGRRPNPLARALDALARNDRVKVSEKVRGSPVHVAEVARVIHGIIDQMGAGAPRSGVYHYSGIGEVNAYSFMETVLANASQYQPF
ncbi:MAG: sugar nucleotide-binding protein, partial [Halieaceae bacterium]